nr:ATP-grasp domain-containing protein [Kibdelosporangium sp. MJ126-NF4]CEL13019.1 Putative ligase/carboxylase protein [Kibdelosporangium sp. MJ126-NF4]CTQ98705.1 Putative ligase/carboxylase protein [Kibdelosporangium sp. MJ126-NF4]
MTGQPSHTGRRLLVAGASPMRESAFALWQRLGIEIVLVDGYTTGRYEHMVHEFVPWDPRDGSADITRIAELARACDGVTTLADNSQVTAAAVAEEVGLPGIGRAAANVARSKLEQRRLCADAGMDVPRWQHIRERADLDRFFDGESRPVVLKPVDCAGSAGVLRVDDVGEARQQWPVVRMLSPSRTVLAEDFVGGREVCVEAVVTGGKPVFVSVCQADYADSEGFLAVSAAYAAIQPDQATAWPAMAKVVTALGLGEGVMQAEFKITGDRWTLLEATFRPGGALVPDLTARVTGVNLYEVQADIAFGLEVLTRRPAAPVTPFAQVRFLVGGGQVRKFVPPATVLADLPDVKVANQLAAPGQHVRLPLSEDGRAGYAAGWGEDAEVLDAQLRTAIDRLGTAMGLTRHQQLPRPVDVVAR